MTQRESGMSYLPSCMVTRITDETLTCGVDRVVEIAVVARLRDKHIGKHDVIVIPRPLEDRPGPKTDQRHIGHWQTTQV